MLFSKPLSNQDEYFSGSFSGGDKITLCKTCQDIAKKLKTGMKVMNYIQFQKISILVGPLECVDIATAL